MDKATIAVNAPLIIEITGRERFTHGRPAKDTHLKHQKRGVGIKINVDCAGKARVIEQNCLLWQPVKATRVFCRQLDVQSGVVVGSGAVDAFSGLCRCGDIRIAREVYLVGKFIPIGKAASGIYQNRFDICGMCSGKKYL